MASGVTTTVTELPESRVRVEAEVPAPEVERRLAQTAQALGREMKIPGFRKGKVPPPVIIGRVGRSAVLDEAVRSSLGPWYVEAVSTAGIVPVGDPELHLEDLPGEGEPLRFSIEIGVRPTAHLGDYKGLEVGRRGAEVADEAIDAELEALRERLARLETIERAGNAGDFMVLDLTGTVDGEPFAEGDRRDELVELGANRLPEGLEEELIGAAAGEERSVDIDVPADSQDPRLAGRTVTFQATVKEVKEKILPALDDDLAVDAAGFDSLEELRSDIRSRLEDADRSAIETEFREAAVDAAVAAATVEVTDALIVGRASELWEQLAETLRRQGIDKETYLRISGKEEEELLAEARPDAERALRREAVIAAVVEAEAIEASDAEVLETLEHSADHEKTTAEKLRDRLEKAGRLDTLRADIASRKAVDLLAESATPIPIEQAQAREKIWTPDKEGDDAPPPAGEAGKLWTPGS